MTTAPAPRILFRDPPPPTRIPRAMQVISDGMDAGLHRGAQVWVSLRGEVAVDAAVGEAREGVAMASDTLMPWRSCSKPPGAVAIAQLWERGALKLDDPVGRFVPGFESGRKERITIRHLLVHTAGIRRVTFDPSMHDWDEIIRRIAAIQLEPDWEPGLRAAYHVRSSWYLLGEIVRVVTGTDYGRHVREHLFAPLGMRDSWVGMPDGTADSYGDRLGRLWDTTKHPPEPDPWGGPDAASDCSPGASGHGPMRDLGRFYLALLNGGELDDARILSPQTVEALTARHRVGLMDETFMHKMDWGLGFILNSNHYGADSVPYGFGKHSSPRTFGHGGSQSSASFADPEHGLVVAVVFNGTPGDARHSRRIRQFATALYEDLGLAG